MKFKLNNNEFLSFCKGAKISFLLNDVRVEVIPPHYEEETSDYKRGLKRGAELERYSHNIYASMQEVDDEK